MKKMRQGQMGANMISHCHFHVCMVAKSKLDLYEPFNTFVSDVDARRS